MSKAHLIDPFTSLVGTITDPPSFEQSNQDR